MANLSLRPQSATGKSQASSRNGAQSPFSRSSSPRPKAGDTATIVAFNNARDTYQKSLSEKDFDHIMLPTAPEDVVNDVEQWHRRHLDSKVAASVRSGLAQLQRFGATIDMLAQGTPSPGCLLWGSIKFVLTVSTISIVYARCSVSDFYVVSDCEPQRSPSFWSLSSLSNCPQKHLGCLHCDVTLCRSYKMQCRHTNSFARLSSE